MHASFIIRKGMHVRMKRHPMVGIVLKIHPRTSRARVKFKLCTKLEPIATLVQVPHANIDYTEVGPLDKTYEW